MDLNQLVSVLGRRWRLFLVVLVACLLGSFAAAWAQQPIYQASATLVAINVETGGDESAQRQLTNERAAALSQFATTAPVLTEVIAAAARATGRTAHPPITFQVQATGTTPFLEVTVTDADPRWAKAVADAFPVALPRALDSIDPAVAEQARQLAVLAPASLPASPASPNRTAYVAVGLILGIVMGLSLIVLRQALDRRVHDPQDVGRTLSLPLLGVVPLRDHRQELPVRSAPRSARAEAYRAVAANLLHGEPTGLPSLIVVTAPSTGAGASTVTANLAVTLASGGRRVLLVDADLRTPHLHSMFGIPSGPGLAELLTGEAEPAQAIRSVDDSSLRVLAAGRPLRDPVEHLSSGRLLNLLETIRADVDVILVDTPPVLAVADALFLAAQADAVVLVARSGDTSQDQLHQARVAIRRVRGSLVGLVVNGTPERVETLSVRPDAPETGLAAERRRPLDGTRQ